MEGLTNTSHTNHSASGPKSSIRYSKISFNNSQIWIRLNELQHARHWSIHGSAITRSLRVSDIGVCRAFETTQSGCSITQSKRDDLKMALMIFPNPQGRRRGQPGASIADFTLYPSTSINYIHHTFKDVFIDNSLQHKSFKYHMIL